MGKGAIQFALQDVIYRPEHKPTKSVIQLRCSNVTQVRPAIINWLQTCPEDIIALQETHLAGAALRDFVRKLAVAGFRVFEGDRQCESATGLIVSAECHACLSLSQCQHPGGAVLLG